MSTRAVQITELLTGLVHPTTGAILSSHTAFFYAAGTSTPKNVWTEKEKTNAYTEYDLSAIGNAQLYAEGLYKIVIEVAASGDDGDIIYTWDNLKFEHPNYYVHTITEDHDQTSEDDYVLVNTTSGQVTISMLAAADWTHPFKFRRTSGSNSVVIDPDGSETIDGDATLTINSDAIIEIVSNGSNLITAGFKSSFADADNDTKIQLEEAADEDKIRFDCAGTEVMRLNETSIDLLVPLAQDVELSADVGNVIKSADTGALLLSGGTDATDGGAIRLNGDNESPAGNVVVYSNNSAQLTVNDTGIHPSNASVFVNNADGGPYIDSTANVITTTCTRETWESYGPTSSGADNEWAALSDADIVVGMDWVDVRFFFNFSASAGGAGNLVLSARATGSEVSAANSQVAGVGTVVSGYTISFPVVRIPVNTSTLFFDLYWTDSNSTSSSITATLVGAGYNQ
jgi:hypothetical protein